MTAVLLTGYGGFEKLEYRHDVPVPQPGPGQVLIRVAAAGVNNTDINTRIGWYSKTVSEPTTSEAGTGGLGVADDDEGTWSGITMDFPRIQGGDVCGRIVAVGGGVEADRIGQRVLVDPCLREPVGWRPYAACYLGSECDGGFAQYVAVPSVHVHAVDCGWSDAELASLPIAYSTAENMLTRSGASAGETVLVTGASGGVGSAAVQLAKRRGCEVIAVAGAAKAEAVRELGADLVIPRGENLTQALGRDRADVAIDLVAGPQWPELLEVLRPGGRYATSGAIAGPMVELDVRTLYLKDLSFFGCTVLEPEVFPNLVGYVERGEIRPALAGTYPLADIVRAQEDFLAKAHTGKLVLIPPPD